MPLAHAPLPPRAKAELTAAFALLQRKSARNLLHYLLAVGPDKRDAEEEIVRLVLVKARDGSIIQDAVLWRLYDKDVALDPAQKGKYKLSRGLIKIADEQVRVVPSTRGSAQKAETTVRALFRQLDQVTSPVFSNPGLKILVKAAFDDAADPARVFEAFGKTDDDVEEAPPQAQGQSTPPVDTRGAEAALAAWKRLGKDIPAAIVEVYEIASDTEMREAAVGVIQKLVRDLDKHEEALAKAIDVLDDHEGDATVDRLLAQLGAAVAEIHSLDTELDGVLDDLSGRKVEPDADAGPPNWSDAVASFEEAQETVDKQIARLQSKLRQSGDDELVEIAELGLNALTGDFRVPVKAALLGLRNAPSTDREKALARVRAALSNYIAHLESDEAVAACDDNPFDVEVSIRGTLVKPLKTLLAAAA